MKKEHCLLVIGGRSPFYSEKYDYTKHPNYRYTSDGNKAYSYHYTPDPPEYNHRGKDEVREEIKVKPSDRAYIEVEETKLIDDPQVILRELTTKFQELQPISDELLNDGELTSEGEKVFLEALLSEDREIEDKVGVYMEVSEETRKFLDGMNQTLPHLEDNPVVLINTLGRVARELQPMPDELYDEARVVSGEEQVQAEVIEEILIMEEDEATETLEEINNDVFEEVEALKGLIEADPAFKELLEDTT